MPRSNPDNYAVSSTGCWIWQGAKDRAGYGYCKWMGEKKAHRVQYLKKHGNSSIPAGFHLDHLCRTPACVNPSHLEPVTHAENTRRGLSAKITSQDALEIRKRFSQGESQSALAVSYGLCFQSISLLIRGDAWGDVGGEISKDNSLRMGTRRRLDTESVSKLRGMAAAGVTRKNLAVQFSISVTHVGRIVTGKQRAEPLKGEA